MKYLEVKEKKQIWTLCCCLIQLSKFQNITEVSRTTATSNLTNVYLWREGPGNIVPGLSDYLVQTKNKNKEFRRHKRRVFLCFKPYTLNTKPKITSGCPVFAAVAVCYIHLYLCTSYEWRSSLWFHSLSYGFCRKIRSIECAVLRRSHGNWCQKHGIRSCWHCWARGESHPGRRKLHSQQLPQ